jgi:hypothetical protein
MKRPKHQASRCRECWWRSGRGCARARFSPPWGRRWGCTWLESYAMARGGAKSTPRASPQHEPDPGVWQRMTKAANPQAPEQPARARVAAVLYRAGSQTKGTIDCLQCWAWDGRCQPTSQAPQVGTGLRRPHPARDAHRGAARALPRHAQVKTFPAGTPSHKLEPCLR